MSRTLPLWMTVGLSLVFVGLAACGGDGDKATQTPASPAATTAAPTSTGPGEGTPTQGTTIAPEGREFSQSATVTAEVGDKTLTFENATCVKGADDAWLGVVIGEVASAEYFLLVVGDSTGQEGTRSAKGGGVFTGDEIIVVTAGQGDTSFSLRLSDEAKVTVASDLSSGEFTGTAFDGQPVSGSFKC